MFDVSAMICKHELHETFNDYLRHVVPMAYHFYHSTRSMLSDPRRLLPHFQSQVASFLSVRLTVLGILA